MKKYLSMIIAILILFPGLLNPGKAAELDFLMAASVPSIFRLVPSFDPDITDYFVGYPNGTEQVPEIDYTLANGASAQVLKATNFNETTAITVNSGGTQRVYRFRFTTLPGRSILNGRDFLQETGEGTPKFVDGGALMRYDGQGANNTYTSSFPVEPWSTLLWYQREQNYRRYLFYKFDLSGYSDLNVFSDIILSQGVKMGGAVNIAGAKIEIYGVDIPDSKNWNWQLTDSYPSLFTGNPPKMSVGKLLGTYELVGEGGQSTENSFYRQTADGKFNIARINITEYVQRELAKGNTMITLMTGVREDNMVWPEAHVSFGPIINVPFFDYPAKTNASTAIARPTLLFNRRVPDSENRIKSVEVDSSKGIIEPAFNPDITNYRIGVLDGYSASDAEFSYTPYSIGSIVRVEQEAQNIGESTVIKLTSELGESKTYTFTFVPFSDLGYTEDGKMTASNFVLSSDTLLPGMVLKASADLRNNSIVKKEATLLMGVYQNDCLIDAAISKESIPAGSSKISAQITLPSSIDNIRVETFLWDNLENMVPFVPSITLPESTYSYTELKDPINVYYKSIQAQSATVTGKMTPNKQVTATVYNPGKTIDDVEYTAESIKENFAGFIQQTTNSHGYYGFDLNVSKGSGEYFIQVYDSGTNRKYINEDFYFAEPAQRIARVEEIYSAQSKTQLQEILNLTIPDSEAVKELRLNTTPFSYMSVENVCEILFGMMKKNPFDQDNPDVFMTLYDHAVLLENINLGKISDIGIYRDLFGFDESLMKAYNPLRDEIKNDISEKGIAGKGFRTLDQLKPVFKEALILAQINYLSNGAALIAIIDKYKADLDLSQGHYQKYKSFAPSKLVTLIDKLTNGRPYSTSKAFKNKFETVVDQLDKPSNPSTGGGRNNGNTSSIGVSGSVNMEKVPTDVFEGESATVFQDLKGYEWVQTALETLYKQKMIQGVGEGKYEPERMIMREEFIKLIITLFEDTPSSDIDFKDVSKDRWYYSYIAKAVAMDIAVGKGDGTFGVGEGLLREDMCVLAARALSLLYPTQEVDQVQFADDNSISEYAKESIYRLKKLGIVSGTGNNQFEPKRVLNRAEAAQIIYNLMQLIQNQ